MPYFHEDLSPTDTTSLSWALAWTRFYLRDTSETEAYTDVELQAALTATAFVDDTETPSVTYYRPHIAVGMLIDTDPDRALSESTLGASITNRPASSIARSVRSSGRWIDDAIEALADVRPSTSLTLIPRF